ncbi:MAG: AMMECR1 domain-containing protein [Elusimicrobia bacterium]|nr:MAG: AMMECR1 domain-containing protein [Elusimicrobiota bacterium]KAF0154335.1 MAG: AMMECR1 domain-containing protein [Elusimicrobiota bacterium]
MLKRPVFFAIFLLLAGAAGAAAREPQFAGSFYPAAPAELTAAVDKALAAAKPYKGKGKVAGILVPHAGYVFSGGVAAHAFASLKDQYDTVVLLGSAHAEGFAGAAVMASGHYATPLGKAEVDARLAAALIKKNPFFRDYPRAHARDHNLEVQIPFLQRRLKKPFRILPVLFGRADEKELEAAGRALGRLLKGRKVLLLISTDLSHYPSSADARRSDLALLKALEKMDPAYFRLAHSLLASKKPEGLETPACGSSAVEAGLHALREVGAARFDLLGYSDSHREYPAGSPETRVVGYGSGVFLAGAGPASFSPSPSREQKKELLRLARRAVERAFDGTGRHSPQSVPGVIRPAETPPAPPAPPALPVLADDPFLNLPAGVFVTLNKSGALRGCIGNVSPSYTLRDAVVRNALSAAFEDRRFEPLSADELPLVRFEISLLSPLELAAGHDEVKPGVHGVAISKKGKSGLFLPQVWGQLPSKEVFLGELCEQKAGLPRDCWKDKTTEFYLFTSESFEELR